MITLQLWLCQECKGLLLPRILASSSCNSETWQLTPPMTCCK